MVSPPAHRCRRKCAATFATSSLLLLALLATASTSFTAAADTRAVSSTSTSPRAATAAVAARTSATGLSAARLGQPSSVSRARPAVVAVAADDKVARRGAVPVPPPSGGGGLVPCGGPPSRACFVLRTPFPPNSASTPPIVCTLLAAPNVTLDGVPVPVLSFDFNDTDVTFVVNIEAAADAASDTTPTSVRPSLSLEARAQLSCPTEILDSASHSGTSGDGRVSWIFPWNFYLVEEVAFLGDSIETLVEAVDNLEITVTGDDGSEEFFYGDNFSRPGYALNIENEGSNSFGDVWNSS